MEFLLLLIFVLFAVVRPRAWLLAETLALRHQLIVLRRSVSRPRLKLVDRLLWAFGLRQLPSHLLRLLGIRIRKNHHELVTTQSREGV